MNTATGARLGYGALAAEAGALDAPGRVRLKPEADWRLLGRSLPRTDMVAKCEGAPLYASDVELPGMLHANADSRGTKALPCRPARRIRRSARNAALPM